MEFFRGSNKESGLGFLFDVPIVGYFVFFFFSNKIYIYIKNWNLCYIRAINFVWNLKTGQEQIDDDAYFDC